MKKTTENKISKEKKPFLLKTLLNIAVKEKFHFLWLVFIIYFAFINLWMALLIFPIDSAIEYFSNTADLYIASIALLAPCLYDLLSTIYFDKKRENETHFLKIRFAFVIIGFILCSIITYLSMGDLKNNVWLKIIIPILIILFSFFSYLSKYLKLPDHAAFDEGTLFDDSKKDKDELKSKTDALADKASIGNKEVQL